MHLSICRKHIRISRKMVCWLRLVDVDVVCKDLDMERKLLQSHVVVIMDSRCNTDLEW